MSTLAGERFGQLIHFLSLREISPVEIRAQRFGDPSPSGGEIRLEWKQAYADGDPLEIAPNIRLFRPKYEFILRQGGFQYFRQTSIFLVAFQVADLPAFAELWGDEEVRRVFLEKQLQRTMWPIFRQHALSGMTAVSLPPVPLPWLT